MSHVPATAVVAGALVSGQGTWFAQGRNLVCQGCNFPGREQRDETFVNISCIV